VVFWAWLRRSVFIRSKPILAAGSAKLPHAIVRIESNVELVACSLRRFDGGADDDESSRVEICSWSVRNRLAARIRLEFFSDTNVLFS
jgi:hypothetical protein